MAEAELSAVAVRRSPEPSVARGLVTLFADHLNDISRERAAIAGLNARGCLIAFQEMAGSSHIIDDMLPMIRSILAKIDVAEIVVAHSHPFSFAAASEQDRLTTNRLAALARLAGASLTDHLIFGTDGVYSLADGTTTRPNLQKG
jgi:DNA repair protein RadC